VRITARLKSSAVGTLVCAALISFGFVPAAHAVNYTVTYYANETQFQAGAVSGSVPSAGSYAAGTLVTASGNTGNLARQGFVFNGWNTSANGTGDHYAAGSQQFTISNNVSFYAEWTIPASARLIGSGGSVVTILDSNSVTDGDKCAAGNIRGVTSDGTNIFFRPSSNPSYICKTTMAGVVVEAHNIGTTLGSTIPTDSMALSYSSGCLFIRGTGAATTTIYCIDISDWTITARTLPTSLYAGQGWGTGYLIDFPDGRIGAVSQPGLVTGNGSNNCPSAMYCKVLRLYSITNRGKNVSFTSSEDIYLADPDNTWPSDDHGIATDGTYLYEIKYNSGYKVWALRSGAPSYLVFNGDSGSTCGATSGTSPSLCPINAPVNGSSVILSNATYIGHNHASGTYLMGDYNAAKVYVSNSVLPPPGPGTYDPPPSFNNSASFNMAENSPISTNAATISVSESSTITISGGVDSATFSILINDSTTAYIRFKVSPDFEAPTDVGANNVYDLIITAVDSTSQSTAQSISITVTNVNESGSIGPPTLGGPAKKMSIVTISVTANTPGTVRFMYKGRLITGCAARPTTGSYPNVQATCPWKPIIQGQQYLSAALTPSDNTFSSVTSATSIVTVGKRTSAR
jgi:uncharacterized repeat protein (TIGR02543 family)